MHEGYAAHSKVHSHADVYLTFTTETQKQGAMDSRDGQTVRVTSAVSACRKKWPEPVASSAKTITFH